ncbi:DJ-1/PfpI family protein [Bacillus cereus]|uniref:DJ-1/PfpI family protein n=1 Tax=Bacillus cereus TaxID=1396 RepID=UPI000BF31D51|nr:DJ-1/PfpI family protein [Bacillus cereus]PEX86956.1 peptidase [Bacillus cereus]
MTKKALFIIPPERFNEDELFHPKEVLEAAGIQVTIASTKVGEITGDYEGKAHSDITFSEVSANNYEIVAVIGGSGTIDYLWGNQDLINFLKQAYDQKVLVTGICAGSVVVSQTGLLSGRKATCYPVDVMINTLKDNNVEYIAQHVIAHDDIITSDGPEGAIQFGESIVKTLK